jgi:hypothetical protein
LRAVLICGLAGAILLGLSLRRIEPLPLSSAPLRFESQRAYDYMVHLAKTFPYRTTWSEPRKLAGVWLKDELRSMGYEPKGMFFSETIAGKDYTDLENIYVEKRGTKHPDEIVVVTAHYDIVDTTIEGAMDDASGVGVVLELARVFAHEDSDRTLLFMLTDSEEYGAFWGARSFARNFDRARQIVADINFDFVVPEHQTGVLTLCDGLKTGYTPLWLRELALDSLYSLGLRIDVMDFMNVMEMLERAMEIPPADHGPFLAEGIPAFNWAGQTANFPHIMAHYHHTKYDVAEAMEVESFTPFGKGAERLIRSINQLPRLPDNFRNSSYWKLSRHIYVEGWAVTILHILCFIPFLIFSLARFSRIFRPPHRARVKPVLRNEAKHAAILLGSFLFGYTVMLLLPALKVVTQYEVFPATQKSLILYSPDFVAMLLVVAAVVGVYFVFRKFFAEPDDDLGYSEIRQAFLAFGMAVIIFLAFLKNSYLGLLVLLPPAYFWAFIRHSRRTPGRVVNLLLLLGGSITFLTMIIVMTMNFHIGAIYWYMFLAASYGLFSAYAVVLSFMAFTLMFRLLRAIVT